MCSADGVVPVTEFWGRWSVRFFAAAAAVWVLALTAVFLVFAVFGAPVSEVSTFVLAVVARLSMGFIGLALIFGAVWFLLAFWGDVYGSEGDR
jgi:hypothetical protein